MSAEAVGWVWKYSPYKGRERLIHLALADSTNDMNDNEIWARQNWVAEKAGVGRQLVNTWMAKAVADGFMELLENNAPFGKPNRYRFLMPSDVIQLWDPRQGGVVSHDRGVSCHTTGGVVSHDTEPNKNQKEEPNLSDSSSSPSSNTARDDNSQDNESARTPAPTQGSGLSYPPTITDDPPPIIDPPSDARTVFDSWVEVMGKDPKRTKLTSTRRSKINARLRSGELEVSDLIDAIHGAKENPWMMGENDRNTVFDDLVTILKNDESAHRHARFHREGGKVAPKKPVSAVAGSFDAMREKFAPRGT